MSKRNIIIIVIFAVLFISVYQSRYFLISKAPERTRPFFTQLVDGIINKTFGIEKQPKIGAIESSLKHRKEEFRYLRIIKSFIGLTPN